MFKLLFEKLLEFMESQRNKNLYLFFFSYYFIVILTGILSFIFGSGIILKTPNVADLPGSVVFAFTSYFILIGGWLISGLFEGIKVDQYFKINEIFNYNIPSSLDLINKILPVFLALMFIFLLILKPLLLILSYMIYTILDGFFSYEIKLLYNKSKFHIESTLSELEKSGKVIGVTKKQMQDYFSGSYKFNLAVARFLIAFTSLFFYQHPDVLYVAFSVAILINETYFFYKRLPIYKAF